MNEAIYQIPESGAQTAVAASPSLSRKEKVRRVELECAERWADSARYWRAEAAKYLLAGNAVMAGEALLNAGLRETYAAEDLAKAGAGAGAGLHTNSAN